MLANESLAELRRSQGATAAHSKESSNRGDTVRDLLVHEGNDPEDAEVRSRLPNDTASVSAPGSQQHEVESKLSVASSRPPIHNQYHASKGAVSRLKKLASEAGKSHGSDQKTKESSNSGSKCPSIHDSGSKRGVERRAQDRAQRSNIKGNILAMEDVEEAYQKSVKQMKGFNQDRLAMISRNLLEHKMNSVELEDMLEQINCTPVIKRHNSLALQKIMLPNVKREMEDALNQQDVRCGQAYHYATTPKPSSASKALNIMRNQ